MLLNISLGAVLIVITTAIHATPPHWEPGATLARPCPSNSADTMEKLDGLKK